VSLGEFLDHVGHLATTPVFDTVDFATTAADQTLVPIDHCGYLLALIRVDDKNYFIVTHHFSLRSDY
jgi:hypothetical protein